MRKLQGLMSPRLREAQCHCCHFLCDQGESQANPDSKEKGASPSLDRRNCRDGGCAASTVASGLELSVRRGVMWPEGLESSCGSKNKGKLLKWEILNLIKKFPNSG